MTSPAKNVRSLLTSTYNRSKLVTKLLACFALGCLFVLFAGLWIRSSQLHTEAVWLYRHYDIGYAKTYTGGVSATLFLNDDGYRSTTWSREVDPHLAQGSPPRADFYETDPNDFKVNLLAFSLNVSPPLEPYKLWNAPGKVRVITVSVNYLMFFAVRSAGAGYHLFLEALGESSRSLFPLLEKATGSASPGKP